MFVLAHLSDPHLSPLPRPRFAELLNKRITGFLNWKLWRAKHHLVEVLDAMVEDVLAQQPDHVVVTGDLTNLSLDKEYGAAVAFLGRLGESDRVTVIPGNHDAYVPGADRKLVTAWEANLAGDSRGGAPFPFLRRRGDVALIGLSTAVPTLPFFATGRLGRSQLDRLSALLADLGRQPVFRIVLIHHPPAGSRPWLRRLEDAARFRRIIADVGAELILCGHDHAAFVHQIDGPDGPVPVVQVPSASAPVHDRDGAGGYNLYRIEANAGRMTCDMVHRAILADGTVGEVARRRLVPPVSANREEPRTAPQRPAATRQ